MSMDSVGQSRISLSGPSSVSVPEGHAQIEGHDAQPTQSIGRRIGDFFKGIGESIGGAFKSLADRIVTGYQNWQASRAEAETSRQLGAMMGKFDTAIEGMDVTDSTDVGKFLRGNDDTSRSIAQFCKPRLGETANRMMQDAIAAFKEPDGSFESAYSAMMNSLTGYGNPEDGLQHALRDFPEPVAKAMVEMTRSIEARAMEIAKASGRTTLTPEQRENVEKCKQAAIANVLLRGLTPHISDAIGALPPDHPDRALLSKMAVALQGQVNGKPPTGNMHGHMGAVVGQRSDDFKQFMHELVRTTARDMPCNVFPKEFDVLLHDPAFSSLRDDFVSDLTHRQLSGENIKFWLAVESFKADPSVEKAQQIFDTYVDQGVKEHGMFDAEKASESVPVNLDNEDIVPLQTELQRLIGEIDAGRADPSSLKDVFNSAQGKIQTLMQNDSFPKFLKANA